MKSLIKSAYRIMAIGSVLTLSLFVFAGSVNAATTTVTTPLDLTAALSTAVSGDVITVDGTLGSTADYTIYEVTAPNVTISGASGNKIYGTFNLKGDNDTLDGLNVYSRGGGSDSLKNAVNVVSKSVNIINSRFEMPNPDAVSAGGGVGNGIVVWPFGSATPNLNIAGNTFVGYGATVPNWASTAVLIAEQIDMARVGMGGTTSLTIAVDNEQAIATGNSFTGSYYDYVHSNWNGGYSVSYSRASNLPAVLDLISDSSVGATVLLGADMTTTSQILIDKSLTIDGLGHTLFANITNGANSALTISANDVTIKNLVENGTGSTGIHGFNIYMASNVTLDTVTASNNNKSGITVNGSVVTVNNMTTAGNAWGGINVDLGSGVVGPATLNVNGTSSHTESTAIWIDDIRKAVSVVDANHQYSHVDTGNTRVFSLLATGQTTPDESGTATITDTNKDVVVTSTTQPITIETGNIADATIDFGSLVTGGTGTIPQTTINSDVAKVEIPATTITSTDTNWDGTINLPKVTVTTVQPTAEPGKTNTVVGSIEVGYGDTHITFYDPVKLTFAGQAGSLIGWSQNGAFHSITATCDSATAPTLDADSECKIDVGADLVVWTKHFTTFTTFTQASVSLNKSGGRSANRFVPTLPSQASPVAVGRVLGAETENTAAVALQITAIKAQLADLIRQLITLLQAEIQGMR